MAKNNGASPSTLLRHRKEDAERLGYVNWKKIQESINAPAHVTADTLPDFLRKREEFKSLWQHLPLREYLAVKQMLQDKEQECARAYQWLESLKAAGFHPAIKTYSPSAQVYVNPFSAASRSYSPSPVLYQQ